MRLGEIVDIEDLPSSAGVETTEVTGVTADSRKVQNGYAFVAISGSKLDGARFIPDALSQGATVIVAEPGNATNIPPDIAVIETANPRRLLTMMAARLAGRQPDVILAVTGTSGKTSVVDFTRQILTHLGLSAASLGTIGVVKPDGAIYGSLTTPDPVTLHETLASLADEGITHLAFEASSHGLDQHRLDGVKLSAAAFTNLGRDHMDYHATVEDYLAAKMRLFTELLPADCPAIINADGARSQDVIAKLQQQQGRTIFTVGANGKDLKLHDVVLDGFAQRLTLQFEGKAFDVRLPLPGAYQVENALVAAGLAIAGCGLPAPKVFEALEHLSGVPGRLQIVGQAGGGLAIVDYAHKPEALEAALQACRPFATGRLICVFGCGGDRDRGKRPVMGEIADCMADVVIVTDDNPRTEEPAAIRAEIMKAAPDAREIGDRAEAIETAIRMLSKGDVVLVAGKGHETGQIIADRTIPFSDFDEIASSLERINNQSG